jgi:hypothetical protein
MSYLPRIVDRELDELIEALPAIAVEGAKGVGKTETAQRRAGSVHRLDDPAQRALAEAEPDRVLGDVAPVLIDEWQRAPQLWDQVRRAVDAGAAPGSFLLTGSATPVSAPTHSGAARVVTVRMRPLSLSERQLDVPTVSLSALLGGGQPSVSGRTDAALTDYVREIVGSGFPGLRGLSGRPLRAMLDGYLRRIVDTDFPEQEQQVRRPDGLRRWMTAYAAATATSAHYETIRDAATPGEANKPAKTTTIPYRDTLERLWIVDPVSAWLPSRSAIARLTRAPKHHLVDPALAARLIGATAETLLSGEEPGPAVPRDGTLAGHLFESLVTLSVRAYAQASEASVGHLRTAGGTQEVDLIAERADGRVVALEVKLAREVRERDVRHLLWLRDKLGADLLDAVVVTAGPKAYRRADGIAVVPAALLGP